MPPHYISLHCLIMYHLPFNLLPLRRQCPSHQRTFVENTIGAGEYISNQSDQCIHLYATMISPTKSETAVCGLSICCLLTGETSLGPGQEDRVGIVSIPGRHLPLHSNSVLAIDLLSMCAYACIQIHTTWCISYANVKAYNMKKSRHNDSLSRCSMKLYSCKLSTDTNEVLLCSASVSVRNVVGC